MRPRLKFPPRRKIPPRMLHGCADLRLAVVSPFVDRRHGTERALAELLERLARDEHCEIHLYAQRVEDLALDSSSSVGPANSGRIVWHKVPSIPGPHLLKFLGWLFLNSLCRAWDRRVRGLHFDLVLSPGRSEEHTSELQSPCNLVCRLLLEKKKIPRPISYAVVFFLLEPRVSSPHLN